MNHLKERKLLYTFLLLVDTFLVLGSYYAAFLVKFPLGDIPERNFEAYVAVLPWIALISVIVFLIYDTYAVARRLTWETVSSTIVSTVVIAGCVGLASFVFRAFALPRLVILIGSVISFFAILLWKFILSVLIKENKQKVLLIGSDEEISHVKEKVAANLPAGSQFNSCHPGQKRAHIFKKLQEVDTVFICAGVEQRVSQEIIQASMMHNVQVYVVPASYELLLKNADARTFDDLLVMSVKDWGLPLEQQLIKRAGDLVFSLCLLVVTLPITVLTALAIKFSEPKHPVFYKQKRITMHDKEFNIYKFRTMVPNAEGKSGPVLAEKNDNRITKIGKFLRATRIDELPQLFNVLKGDMSVVGPRPERPHFTEIYKKTYGNYCYRTSVKAGLTGLAQIAGKYETDVEDKLRYDLYYIRNYSVFFDIVIILKTFKVVLDKQKADGVIKPKQRQTKVSSEKNVGM